MKTRSFKILALVMVISLMIPTLALAQVPGPNSTSPQFEPVAADDIVEIPITGRVIGEVKGATEPAIYIIQFEEPPLPAYSGGVAGLEATAPSATGAVKLDASSPASVAYRQYLADKQGEFVAAMEKSLGRSVVVKHQYQLSLNGIAVELTPAEAAKIAARPGVSAVIRNWVEYPLTDHGPAWVGAEGVWDGSATGVATMGEGMVIAIVDTGINMDHPSFADVGDDGYDHTNPRGQFYGWCDPTDPDYDPSLVCNDKLIGVWSGDADSPEDAHMHGSHVGSIAAGNVLDITYQGNTTVYEPTISGVAPHANIIAYSIEGTPGAGSAPGDIIIAATEALIEHGVDVVNYSFGGGPGDPWVGAQHWLNVIDAGIFVATSCGNDGPGAATLGSPANAPWLLSVGNATHNRVMRTALVDMTGGDTTPPADMLGAGFTAGYGPAPIVYAGDYGDGGCMDPFPAGTFSGEIVVCDRGVIARMDKGYNVLQGGAGALVLANAAANGESINDDDHYLPAVHIPYSDAVPLKEWIATGTGHTATIEPYYKDLDPGNGDLMAAGSSRGPNADNTNAMDVIKPDVIAPGTGILGAENTINNPKPAPEFGFHGGTSMASPHVAGAAALLLSLNPGWTPAEVRSALMTTAIADQALKEDFVTPADPFDMGAGRVFVSTAASAGLVLDVDPADYNAVDPAIGGDPTTLNLASFGDNQCMLDCEWTREVKSTAAANVTWTASVSGDAGLGLTVTPASFELAPGATQEILVEAVVDGLPADEWVFGTVTLESSSPDVPDAHFPVAVKPTYGAVPNMVTVNTRRNAGSQLIAGLETLESPELTIDSFGLVQADLFEFYLLEDPTNTIPEGFFDDLSQVYWSTIMVPAGAKRIVAEILDTTSPDLDMAIGFDTNGDGLPSEDEIVFQSATGTAYEYCDVANPDAGTWWVVVMNWAASVEDEADYIKLATGVVADADAGNMTFDAPDSVPAATPFDIRLFWDTPEMVAGDHWYGVFSLGTDRHHPGDIAFVPVNIIRHTDDVIKTVNADFVNPGDIVDFTITVDTNVTPEDMTYLVIDTLPEGLTYVPGSAAVTEDEGVVNVVNNRLTWIGEQPTPVGAVRDYVITTSATDPMCDTGFGGYVNLQAFGILAQSGISGDTSAWSAFSTGNPFEYYGEEYVGFAFTDDGFGLFDPASNYAGAPWVPQFIPDAAFPNNVVAPLWQDMEIFYDGALNHGVSLATAGPNLILVEYDDLQFWGGSAETWDFEIVMTRAVDDTPGAYEIVFAYDNLSTVVGPLTIGVENAAGTAGSALVNQGDASAAISDGSMVCLDFVGPKFEPIEITYSASVDGDVKLGSLLTNDVIHTTSNLGSKDAFTHFDLHIGNWIFLPFIAPTEEAIWPVFADD